MANTISNSTNLQSVGGIFPGNLSEVVWKKTNIKIDLKRELFWTNFFVQSLFFDKITIPIKSIINNPFFYDIAKNNEIKSIQNIFRLISIHNSDHRVEVAKTELLLRKDLILPIKKIEEFAEILTSLESESLKINKKDFHTKYLENLKGFLGWINKKAFIINKNVIIPKGNLKDIIRDLEEINPKKWTEENYFGSRSAIKIIKKYKARIESKRLIDIVHSIWEYTLKTKSPLFTAEPTNYSYFQNLFLHMKRGGDPHIIGNDTIVEMKDYEMLLFPIPRISESYKLDSIIALKESRWIKKYRELVSLIRESNDSDLTENILKKIRRKYFDALLSILKDASAIGADKEAIEKTIEKQEEKFIKCLKKLDYLVNPVATAFSIAIMSFNLSEILKLGLEIPSIALQTHAFLKWKREQYTPIDYFGEVTAHPYWYNPVTGYVTKLGD